MGDNRVVIGIDGGGTHTRAMVSRLNGQVLSYVESGAASIRRDSQAREHVQHALREAIQQANRTYNDVIGLCGGMAGLDREEDLQWVTELTDLEGLHCPKWHVNDAVIAHKGAFLGDPGIVIISGTGSIILAINERHEQLTNYDFQQYANSAARLLAYQTVFELFAGNQESSDESLITQVLDFWEVKSIHQLRGLSRQGYLLDRQQRDRRFGQMAPMITAAALAGSVLARKVCDRAIEQLAVGVEMLAAFFESPVVMVSGIGSVIQSQYMSTQLENYLQNGKNKQYRVGPPVLPAVSGAVLMALQQLQLPVNDETVQHLLKHSKD